jgi:dimethylargininase
MLRSVGLPVTELDTSEYRKMDGGLTCLSLRLEVQLS